MSNGRKNTAKIIASVALVAGAAGVAGLGTYGAFTSTTAPATADVGSGVIQLAMAPGAGSATSVVVTGMVPGDSIQRTIDLTRSDKSEQFGSIILNSTVTDKTVTTTTGNTGPEKLSDRLAMSVDVCSVPWTVTGATKTLECKGTTTVEITAGTLTNSDQSLGKALNALNVDDGAHSRTAHLRVTVSLPSTGDDALDNKYQGKATTVKFDFTATQSAGKAL